MDEGHIFDYSKITDNIYIGSDLCRGSVCPIHGPEFEKLGVLAEINLSVEHKEIPPDGIDIYVWMPVADMYAPNPEQFDMGTALINETVENNKVIYVHCHEGHGRSPTMVAAYLIRYKKMTTAEAVKFLQAKRPEIHITEVQEEALKQLEEKWE